MPHLAADCQPFFGDGRPVTQGAVDVVERLGIKDQRPGRKRQAPGRDHPAEHLVDQQDFIPHGIDVGQDVHADAVLQPFPVLEAEPLGGVRLDAEITVRNPRRLHDGGGPRQHAPSLPLQQGVVGVKKGLAFCGVDEQRIGPLRDFDRSRKARAACADTAGRRHPVFQFLYRHDRKSLSWFRSRGVRSPGAVPPVRA